MRKYYVNEKIISINILYEKIFSYLCNVLLT